MIRSPNLVSNNAILEPAGREGIGGTEKEHATGQSMLEIGIVLAFFVAFWFGL